MPFQLKSMDLTLNLERKKLTTVHSTLYVHTYQDRQQVESFVIDLHNDSQLKILMLVYIYIHSHENICHDEFSDVILNVIIINCIGRRITI